MNCNNCKIIELAMITCENGKVIEEYDKFVNIGKPLPSKITEITGITDSDLVEKGVGEEVIANDLKERLAPETLMIAHNAQFDLAFICNLLKRHFPEQTDDILASMDWLDTLTVLKDRKDYPHKLVDAVNHYNIEEVNFHRAIDDTKALRDVTLAMINERDDLKEYLNLFGYNPKWGMDEKDKFEFIEYKPQPYHNCGLVAPDDILPRKKLNQRIR